MNFPTAYLFALAGYPIARSIWAGEFENGPSRWISFEGGAWFDNRAESKSLLVSGDSPSLTFGDYSGADWVVYGSPVLSITPQKPFPDTPFTHDVPKFDVLAPAT